MADNREVLLKVVEIVLGLLCFGLYRSNNISFGGGDKFLISVITLGAFPFIITPVILFAHFGSGGKGFHEKIYHTIGAILFLLVAIFSFAHYSDGSFDSSYYKAVLATAILSTANTVVYGIDAFSQWRG